MLSLSKGNRFGFDIRDVPSPMYGSVTKNERVLGVQDSYVVATQL